MFSLPGHRLHPTRKCKRAAPSNVCVCVCICSSHLQVIALEAMPDNQRMLRTSLCASHPDIMTRVTLHPIGIGAVRQQCYLLANQNWGNGVPVRAETHTHTHAGTGRLYPVSPHLECRRRAHKVRGQYVRMNTHVRQGLQADVVAVCVCVYRCVCVCRSVGHTMRLTHRRSTVIPVTL